jgi:branched-subunit amino acid ABC-type transport system permease component
MSYVLLLLLLPVCSFAPGFFFLRRLRWSPMEKLCGSVGLSLVLLYLATWGIYCARVPGGAASYWAVTVICAAMAAASWKDMRQMARNLRVRRALTGQILLWGWAYLILAMIRLYSGAGWFGDDIEHFQRSLFFLHRFPPTTPIWGDYLLPARPPMMNVLGAFFMAQTRDGYDVLQLVFTFLNSLLLLPCCLILPALVVRPLRRRPVRYAPLALAALFALNPAIMQAATYAWTKSLAAFFVVLGLEEFDVAHFSKGTQAKEAISGHHQSRESLRLYKDTTRRKAQYGRRAGHRRPIMPARPGLPKNLRKMVDALGLEPRTR